MEKSRVDLTGVPETMLWPLWNRAAEACREDRLIDDPMAAELVRRIDYDFRRSFGRPSVFHAVRARACDDLVRDYLSRGPEAPVIVSLGEGLETQLWRIGERELSWISVDLPEAIEVRRRLLPEDDRQTLVACSALDTAWMDNVPEGARPFISAAGLLMYFQEADVRDLLTRIAARFSGADLFFDTIPPFVAGWTRRGLKLTKHYTAPLMPWGVRITDIPGFIRSIPGLEPISVKGYGEISTKRTRLYRLVTGIPFVHRRFSGSLTLARSL